MKNPNWLEKLPKGEHILWKGRPDQKYHLNVYNLIAIALGVCVLFLAGFLTLVEAPDPWNEPVVNWAVLLIGLGLIAHGFFWDKARRRRTQYVLTNKHAIIAFRTVLGPAWPKFWKIDKHTTLNYEVSDFSTIWFSVEIHGSMQSTYKEKIGFEFIEDGEKVYRLMRDIQAGRST